MNSKTFLVIGANRFDFEQNGKKFSGCKVRYMPANPENTADAVGYRPIELNTDYNNFNWFDKGMGFYELEFDIVPGTRGTPKMVLVNANFLYACDFSDLADVTNK